MALDPLNSSNLEQVALNGLKEIGVHYSCECNTKVDQPKTLYKATRLDSTQLDVKLRRVALS